MTRRLLFDQNLSPRLVVRLAERFEGSVHAQNVGLSTASGAEVLDFATRQDLIVVTKDGHCVESRRFAKMTKLCFASLPSSR